MPYKVARRDETLDTVSIIPKKAVICVNQTLRDYILWKKNSVTFSKLSKYFKTEFTATPNLLTSRFVRLKSDIYLCVLIASVVESLPENIGIIKTTEAQGLHS